MKHMLKRGFTVVELVIVIAVIAILVVITGVLYIGVQEQARNTQLQDAANKVVGAVQLFYAKYERMPRGGVGSTVAIGAGTECTAGSGSGILATGFYTCTLEDTLRASGYLPTDFTKNLPPNTVYTSGASVNRSIWVEPRPSTTDPTKVMLFYAMENVAAEDTTAFNKQLVACGYTVASTIAPRDTYGMRGGICADL